jgi:hypothetical protein
VGIVARCDAHEIKGTDPSRTRGAARCHRDATTDLTFDDVAWYHVCDQHDSARWELFSTDAGLYAVEHERGTVRSRTVMLPGQPIPRAGLS